MWNESISKHSVHRSTILGIDINFRCSTQKNMQSHCSQSQFFSTPILSILLQFDSKLVHQKHDEIS